MHHNERPAPDRKNLSDRIKVVKSTGCWRWTGATTGRGRPIVMRKGKVIFLSKLFWEQQYKRKTPADRRLWSTCGRIDCVNPAHRSPE